MECGCIIVCFSCELISHRSYWHLLSSRGFVLWQVEHDKICGCRLVQLTVKGKSNCVQNKGWALGVASLPSLSSTHYGGWQRSHLCSTQVNGLQKHWKLSMSNSSHLYQSDLITRILLRPWQGPRSIHVPFSFQTRRFHWLGEPLVVNLRIGLNSLT